MPEISVPLRLPRLRGPQESAESADWLQGPPVTMEFARGAVVLVDFWEATCIHCLRTLPYLVEWHARYRDRGLLIVGVHTPEFEATRGDRAARRVVEDFGISYPVLLDDDRDTWERFANHYWPAKYVADARGYLRWEHVGEGAYAETERFLQKLLREAGDTDPMPEVVDPVRPEDAPGAVCFRSTPEVHLGHHRGRLLSTEGWRPGEVVEHDGTLREPLAPGAFGARGAFLHEAEYIEAREAGAEIELVCEAAGVYLVAAAPEGRDAVLDVLAGGPEGPVREIRFGGVKMLDLVTSDLFAWRHVTVRAREPGVRFYAVSFSGCGRVAGQDPES